MTKKRRQLGMTLVEVVVYVALMGLLLIFTISVVRSAIVDLAQIRSIRVLNNSASFALERIVRSVREAESVDELESILDESPGLLSLDGATTTVFELDGETLHINENAAGAEPLTASDVSVTSLIFRLATSTNSQAVKIELELENVSGRTIRNEKFYSTAVLRGSYQ